MDLKDNEAKLFEKEITTKSGDKTTIFSGSGFYNGVKFDLSGFLNTAKSGQRWMSLQVKEPWQDSEPTPEDADRPATQEDVAKATGEKIPF